MDDPLANRSGALNHPKLDQTTGAVTLRTEGVDAAGNTIKQTVRRACGLTAR